MKKKLFTIIAVITTVVITGHAEPPSITKGIFDYYNHPCEVSGVGTYVQKVKKATYIGGGISLVDYLDLFIEKYGQIYNKDEQVDIKRNMVVEYYLISGFSRFKEEDIKFDIENQINQQDGLKFYKSQQLPLQSLYIIKNKQDLNSTQIDSIKLN